MLTTRHLSVLAVLAVATSLSLGWIDYETKTLGDLFAPQNLPALVIFAAMAFVLYGVATFGVIAISQSIRSSRRRGA